MLNETQPLNYLKSFRIIKNSGECSIETSLENKWWLWCKGSTRDCGSLCTGSNPVSHPSTSPLRGFVGMVK
jgi:hypothetical protein